MLTDAAIDQIQNTEQPVGDFKAYYTKWETLNHGCTELNTHLLCSPFVCSLILVVDSTEVGYNHWDRQSNDQDPAQRTDGSENLPCYGFWYHVTIPWVREKNTLSHRKLFLSATNSFQL